MSFFLIFTRVASTTASAASCAVVLGNDWSTNALDLFVLLFDFFGVSLGVGVDPRLTVLQCVHDLLLLIRIQLLTEAFVVPGAFNSGAHRMNIAIESVLCINALFDLLVFISKLLRLFDHLLNLLLSEPTLVVGDGDLFGLTCALILCANIENAVGVNLKCDFNLRLSTWCWR